MKWLSVGALVLVGARVLAVSPPAAAQARPSAACCISRAELAARAAAELPERLEGLVRAELGGEHPAAGLAVRVDWRGRTLLDRGYGLSDVEEKRPVGPETVFRVGSITKTFTAALILRLEAAGKLRLDQSVVELLPEYAALDRRITIRHLLGHTSGLASYTELPWFEPEENRVIPPAELMGRVLEVPLAFSPGARFAYSNSGYYLLGLIAEKVSGRGYGDLLRDEVIRPAGLRHTGLCPDMPDGRGAARGYRREAGGWAPARPLSLQNPYAAGALCSTTGELVRFAQRMAAGKIVDRARWTAMGTPAAFAGGKTSPYGLGLFVGALEGHRRVGHGGGINGFVSELALFPDDDLTIAVLTNSERSVGALIEQLARAVLGIPEPTIADLPVSAGEAAPLLGSYAMREIAQTVLVIFDGKDLRLTRPDKPLTGHRLRAQGDGAYVVPEIHARLRFELENGRAARLVVLQGGQELHGDRVAGSSTSPTSHTSRPTRAQPIQ